MALETVQGLRLLPVPLNGGIDEVSASDALRPEDAIKFTNWRLSKDGKRIQKRAGLQEEDTAFAQDVYGYTTYYNTTPAFCKIVVLEAKAQRKVGAGAYADLFSFTSNIDHTVNVLEIQGKQFIITEKGSKVIQADGGVRQIGITAPTTLPTPTSSYGGSTTFSVNDSFNYANQAAMDLVWADGDTGANAASTLDTTDPDAVPGPDADAKYLRMFCDTPATYCKRTKVVLTDQISNIFHMETAVYFDDITAGSRTGYWITIDTGDVLGDIILNGSGLWTRRFSVVYRQIVDLTIPENKWIKVKVFVDASDYTDTDEDVGVIIRAYIEWDGLIKGSGETTVTWHPSAYAGRIQLYAMMDTISTDALDFHIDYFKITPTTSTSDKITGLYRYAVSFVRTGNYGCESNAIRSAIGSVTFAGTGVNDMTVSTTESEYTGALSKSVLVKLKTAASPQDTIQWSGDGGITWSAEIKLATKVNLGYGLIVNFATITGHTANDTWTVPCTVCSVSAGNQQITLTSIPTSSDEQVTARKIYRTTADGSTFYYLTTIYDRATTTQYIDNFPDAVLGDELETDRDLFTAASTTIGKFSEWWDNRLWIADATENLIYYSAIREGGPVPEEFSLDERFIPIMRGDQDDTITAMKAYKDALYVFKRNDIFIVQKTAGGYAPYHLNSDLGCVADNCVEVVNDYLMFPSEKGWELYDGVRSYSPDFSVAVDSTYRTVDPAGYKYMSIAHDKEFNEVWLSMPSRLSGAAAITTVWNYVRNRFFFYQFYKTPSWIGRCKDSTGKSVLKMGTRDGYVLLCDYGTADHTTVITATYRKGWIDMLAHGIAHLVQTEYELPAGKTLTLNVYADMQETAFRTAALTGVTPGATDIALRRPIGAKTELGGRGRWFSIEYTNAEDCGGDCKINEAEIYVRPEIVKNKTYAN